MVPHSKVLGTHPFFVLFKNIFHLPFFPAKLCQKYFTKWKFNWCFMLIYYYSRYLVVFFWAYLKYILKALLYLSYEVLYVNKGSLICLICVSSIGPLFKYYDWINSGVGPWSKELTSCLILDYVYVCIESQFIFSWVYWHKREIWALFYTQRTLTQPQ